MITIQLKEEDAYRIAMFLGVQDIDDTRMILDKHEELNIGLEDAENSMQLLFNELSDKLDLEI